MLNHIVNFKEVKSALFR